MRIIKPVTPAVLGMTRHKYSHRGHSTCSHPTSPARTTKQHCVIPLCQGYLRRLYVVRSPCAFAGATEKRSRMRWNVFAVLYCMYQWEAGVCVYAWFRHSRSAVFEGQKIWTSPRFKTWVVILPLIKAVWTAVRVLYRTSCTPLSTRQSKVVM